MTYFVAADASYVEANIKSGVVEGVTMDPEVLAKTIQSIDAFASRSPTIVMPSHDQTA